LIVNAVGKQHKLLAYFEQQGLFEWVCLYQNCSLVSQRNSAQTQRPFAPPVKANASDEVEKTVS
jgi:hypothetical protein